jgi:hypothetical protein
VADDWLPEKFGQVLLIERQIRDQPTQSNF